MANNAISNLDSGSKSTPGVSQCRDVAQGMSCGDFTKVASSTAVLGLCAMAGSGAGSQKTVSLAATSKTATALSLAVAACGGAQCGDPTCSGAGCG